MEKKQLEKKIILRLESKVSLFTFKNNNFILFEFKDLGKKYFRIPNFISSIELTKDSSAFFVKTSARFSRELDKFASQILDYSKNLERPFRKKLILKGLGYKANLTNNNKSVELKLGLSHIINLRIPKEVSLKINKQSINLEGFDRALVGNFANTIRKLRLPDNYKGKGVWYKNEIRILKELKKK